jgi:membrane protease YdiL (CAAX protease family)
VNQILLIAIELMGVISITLILSLSPVLVKRRPLIFSYPKREGIVALSLYVFITILTITIYLIFYHPSTGQNQTPTPFTYTMTQLLTQIGFSLLIFLPFSAALSYRKQPWLSAGLGKASMKGGLQLGIALALISIFLLGKIYSIMNGLTSSQWLYLLAMAVVGFVEEFAFRGYIQLRLCAWWGDTWGWIATSVMFCLWHIPQRIMVQGETLTTILPSLAYLLVLGLVFGWIMKKSGNVLAPAIYHAIHNWLSVI